MCNNSAYIHYYIYTFKKNLLEISHIYRHKSCNFANYILRTKQLITNSTIK